LPQEIRGIIARSFTDFPDLVFVVAPPRRLEERPVGGVLLQEAIDEPAGPDSSRTAFIRAMVSPKDRRRGHEALLPKSFPRLARTGRHVPS
jgi:hypothetical protein